MKRTVGAAVAAMAILGGCGIGGTDRARPDPASPPEMVVGRDVTIRGPVTDVPARQVVTVGRAGQEPLVVILRQPTTVVVGSVLEVTGRVRTFRLAELEAELGMDLEPAVERFEGVSCLLVSRGPAPA